MKEMMRESQEEIFLDVFVLGLGDSSILNFALNENKQYENEIRTLISRSLHHIRRKMGIEIITIGPIDV